MSLFNRITGILIVSVGMCLIGITLPDAAAKTPSAKTKSQSTKSTSTKAKSKTTGKSPAKSETKTGPSRLPDPPPTPPNTPWADADAPPADPGVVTETDFATVFSAEPNLRAVALVNDGQYLQARDVLLENADLAAADHRLESRFLLAWACHGGGDWLCVQSVTGGLADELPLVADYVLLIRATALGQTGAFDDALPLLARIPETSPVFNDAVAIHARVLVEAGRGGEAAEIVSKYLDRPGIDASALGEIADMLFSSDKRDQAIAELRKTFEKGVPGDNSGLRGLLGRLGVIPEVGGGDGEMARAWGYLNLHDNKRALKLVGPMLSGTDPATRCEAAEIAARANTKLRQHDDAFRHFKVLVGDCGKFRDMPSILFLGIRSAYRNGDTRTGDAWTVKLATEFPNATFNDDIAVIRARMAIDEKRHDDAMKILEESVARWPDGDMANESRWLLAWSFITGKKYQQAALRLQDAERMAGGNARYASMFAYWNGRVLQKAGKTADATAAYEHCAMGWPMTFYAILSLNRLAEAAGTDPDAVLAGLVARGGDGSSLTGEPFLRLGRGALPESGPAARALWFYRIGLPEPAMREVTSAPSDDSAASWLKSLFQNMRGDFTPSHRAAKDRLALAPFWPGSASAGYYRLAYPCPFGAEVGAASVESSVDPLLIWAVMREESAFVAGVESWANATGLMQLIMPTAESMAKARGIKITKSSLTDPAVNVRLGATYLRRLLDRFDNPILAIPGYNAGGGAIARWLAASGATQIDEFVESIPASEAREYARKVFESWAAYSYLYGRKPFRVMRVDFRTGGK